jgi:hypothetical protein
MAALMRQRGFLVSGALLVVLLGVLPYTRESDASHEVVRGTGRITTERREVRDFIGVALNVVGDLEIEIADREDLLIEAEDNLHDFIEIEVVDGVLMINQSERTLLRPSRPVRFHITMRALDRVVHSAGGRIHIPRITNEELFIQHKGSGQILMDTLELETLSVHTSGSGTVELDYTEMSRCQLIQSGSGSVKVQHLVGLSNDVRLTGSGDISISKGSVMQQNVFVSGSGDFEGIGFHTSATDVMVSGSGSASVHARDSLHATLTGNGNILYRGNPHVVRSVSGSGIVKRIS